MTEIARIEQHLARQAALCPDAPALRQPGRETLGYAALEAEVRRVTGLLQARGLGEGDRLLIVAENGVETVVLILAALRAGAIASPVNARITPVELGRIVEDAQPRLTVWTSSVSAAAASHAGSAETEPLQVAGQEQRLGQADMSARPEAMAEGPDRPAVLLYTTGTTGRAKGVLLSQGNLLFGGTASARERRMGPGDLILGVLPMTHVFGLTSMMCASLIAGAELWLWSRFSASDVLDALEHGVTLFPGVPQMHAMIMAEAQARGQTRLASDRLRYVSSGAAPLDPDWKRRAEAFYGTALQNGYGMTETTSGVSLTAHLPGDPDTSVGAVLPGCEVRIRPAGDASGIGEVLVRGPNVMLGYFRNPEATAAVLDPEGFLHTGDLGRIDEEGRLHIVGRLKELIIRSGFNVYPPEVEAALNDHPDIVQTAVVGRPVQGNEEVVAFCQRRPGAGVDEAALIDHARQRLSQYKLPSRIVVCDALPAAPSGKILKSSLLSHFADQLDG